MIVLDASFLVKLVLEEKGSEKARELARSWASSGETLVTVDLALPEALNAVWRHALKIGDLDLDKAIDSAGDLLKIWSTLKVYSSTGVAGDAFRLALEEDVTVYDAIYIQLAKSIGAALSTFDGKLSGIAVKRGIVTYP
ncbi:MAG: type II toxin-antitoxin system VapC family toxin [Desulfurococcales archaeon]|nr:type II toxin-antitoxin system VapC family toxin [Desulfurococcales archaeon]